MSLTVKGHVILIDSKGKEFVVKFHGEDSSNICIKTVGLQEFPANYYKNLMTYLAVDDVIVCEVDADNHLLEDPFVTTLVAKFDSVMHSAIRAVRFGGKLLVSIPILEAICKHSMKQNEPGELGEILSTLSSSFNLGVRTTLAKNFMIGYSGLIPIPESDIIKFFTLWHYKNDMRLLNILGLTNTPSDQISGMYISPSKLYDRLITDPLSVHTISSALALHIAKTIEITYTKDQLRVGTLLRNLARDTCGSGNMYVVATDFSSKYKMSTKHFDMLTSQYVTYIPPTNAEGKGKDKGGALYIKELYDIEMAVATQLACFMQHKIEAIPYTSDPEDVMLRIDPQQDKAVNMALSKVVCVITGPAGTGKSTITKKVVRSVIAAGQKVCCTSFTGQATARIEECTDMDCSNMDTMIAHREEYEFDFLVIDEASMVNIQLLYRFLRAFPGPYRVLLIGDVQQLSPIGPGRVFEQLIVSGTIPVTILDTIHRVIDTGNGSVNKIVENSQRIASWGDERFEFNTGPNYQIVQGDQDTVVDEIFDMQDKGYGLDDFVIITPFKEHLPNISRIIQVEYNSSKPFIIQTPGSKWQYFPCLTPTLRDEFNEYESVTAFHIDDRVVVRVNNKKLGTYNGQQGIVTAVSLTEGVTIMTRKRGINKEIVFALRYTNEKSETGEKIESCSVYSLELSNAVTVHRIQGGQRKRIVYWIDRYNKKSDEKFVSKEVTYVATSRASESVLIINIGEAASKSVLNIINPKYDSFAERLIAILPREYMIEQDDLMKKEVAERERLHAEKYIAEYGDISCDDDYDFDHLDVI